MKQKVLFLVEAGTISGLGHLRRMQVLALALMKEGWVCDFGINDLSVLKIHEAEGFTGKLWNGNGLDLGPTDVLIVDGYQYRLSLFNEWNDFCKVSVVIDDLAERPVEVDILLNHNIYGDNLDYSNYKVKKLLVGASYSLVDSRFLTVSSVDKPSIPHILVTFGGTDNGLLSVEIVSSILKENKEIVVELITSPLCKPSTQVLDLANTYKGRLIVHNGVDMAEVMKRCSIIIGAAGFTIIEAIAAGLTPIVCAIADNQKHNITKLKSLGINANEQFDADWFKSEIQLAINSSRPQQNSVIDGQGAQRVIKSIKEFLMKG